MTLLRQGKNIYDGVKEKKMHRGITSLSSSRPKIVIKKETPNIPSP